MVAGISVLALSSCALVPFGPGPIIDNDIQKAQARMGQIVAAITDQDAAALKEQFSPLVRERAIDIDAGLDYLLAFFPSGELAWDVNGVDTSERISYGTRTEVLWCYYDVVVDGQEFAMFFADFTENTIDPDNVGLYALGVISMPDSWESDEAQAFIDWGSRFDETGRGVPGIYVPE